MFIITPYVSVGPIRFGMRPNELLNALGNPSRILKNSRGEPDYQYPDFSVRLSECEHAVVEIGLLPSVSAKVDDIDLFSSPTSFTDLLSRDGSPFEFVGFIILLNLGMTLTGFHDGDLSQKAITVFVKGRWDHLRQKFKKVGLP